MSELDESKKLALHYMQTLVDVARESFLILDSDLRVISANPVFYSDFQVSPEQTENILLYELGNGQWNIPELKDLLEEILPDKKVVKNYQVTHVFESIGKKTIVLNARQIDTVQLIVLAMEDITKKSNLEQNHGRKRIKNGGAQKRERGFEEIGWLIKLNPKISKIFMGRFLIIQSMGWLTAK